MRAKRSEKRRTYEVQTDAMLAGASNLERYWSEPFLPGVGGEIALILVCNRCSASIRIEGKALIPSGRGDESEPLTSAAIESIRKYVRAHEACLARTPKTRGVQQNFKI